MTAPLAVATAPRLVWIHQNFVSGRQAGNTRAVGIVAAMLFENPSHGGLKSLPLNAGFFAHIKGCWRRNCGSRKGETLLVHDVLHQMPRVDGR